MADDACDSFERSIFLVEFTTDVTAFEPAVIAFEETPDTLLKYSFNLLPKTSSFSPNSTIFEGSLGAFFVISANDLAALAAEFTFVAFMPSRESENSFKPLPNFGSSPANLVILLSPVNHALMPPSFGIVADISAIDLAALVAALTLAISNPVAYTEKSKRPLANLGKESAKFEMLFSPANHAATPPSFGIVEHISVIALPASTASFTG